MSISSCGDGGSYWESVDSIKLGASYHVESRLATIQLLDMNLQNGDETSAVESYAPPNNALLVARSGNTRVIFTQEEGLSRVCGTVSAATFLDSARHKHCLKKHEGQSGE